MSDHRFTRPKVLSLLAFEGADLFGPEHAEELSHDNAEDALDEMLENSDLALGVNVLKLLDEKVILTGLSAYKRIPVEEFYRKAWADGLVDHLRENFGEEHTGIDGDDHLNEADLNELRNRMQSTVDWYLSRVKSYPCEVIRTWYFNNDDVRELVEQLKPEWLEKKP